MRLRIHPVAVDRLVHQGAICSGLGVPEAFKRLGFADPLTIVIFQFGPRNAEAMSAATSCSGTARYTALAIMHEWESFETFIKRFYWDTTVYSQQPMELLIHVVGVDSIVYASEMLGGVNATDPATGRSFDDK